MTEQPKLRSLWGLMQPKAPTPPAALPEEPSPAAIADVAVPKGLWTVMRGDGPQGSDVASIESHDAPADIPAAPKLAVSATNEAESLRLAPNVAPTLIAQKSAAFPDWWPVACGAASIPLSAAALVPQYWLTLPAAACGFAALWGSLPVWLEANAGSRRHRLAVTAAVLGFVGVAAGPLLFAPLGRSFRAVDAGRVHKAANQEAEGPRPLGSGASQNP